MQATADESSAEQIGMLRESALDFVQRNADMKTYRARRETQPGYAPGHARQMADMSWFAILVPEAQGGLGLGFGELAVVLQELGKGLLAEPLAAACALAGRVIALAPPTDLTQDLLAGLADGSRLPALAWQEGVGSIDANTITTRAQPDGANGNAVRLCGNKRFVAGAAAAAGFVVAARAEQGIGLYWVPADSAGLQIANEWRADGTPSGLLTFDNVLVPASQGIAAPGEQTQAILERAVDEAAILAGAEMLGVIEAGLAMTLAYMRTRVQFGKAIGSFQALQHKASDLYVQQELTRAVLAEAVAALGQELDATDRALIASRCKARCSDAGLRVTRELIQLHGAIGFTDEYDVGLYLKRALVLSAWLGNASAHRRRFALLARDRLTL